MTSMQNDVQPAQPRRTGLAGWVLWQKLLLAFVALLVVLAVSTWLMMRDSASKVFKTPAHQPTLSETPFSLDGSRGKSHTEMASSTVVPAQQTAVPDAAEMTAPVVQEKTQPAAPQTQPAPTAHPAPQKNLSGDRALIY
ncbi:hypothetical protein [Comamonas kerstersii]|uniref:hypothetical protein n=1 Tax=Comamonas kerstersii TaxID=225992 RepID=UPI001B3301DA|nr:hypothetical protein [Comamonas kerstersii]QTW17448.1 hypothetical protein H8N02_09140 [Comamonas kerstersii]